MNNYLALILALSCITATRAVHIIKDRGKQGKELWGNNYTVLEGDELQIPCNSRPKLGFKSDQYTWDILKRKFGRKTFPEQRLVSKYPRNPAHKTRVFGIKQSLVSNNRELKISNITRYATGTYICTVITDTGNETFPSFYVEKTYFTVNVRAPARIDSTMKTNIVLSAGEKLELDCTSSGNPTPLITWSRTDGRKLVRTIKHNHGILSMHDVGQTARGTYQCIAANSLGKDMKTFYVDVKVAARITTTKVSYGRIGHDGKVKCEAVGNPPPRFTWKWYEGLNSNARTSLREGQKRDRFSVETTHKFENSVSYLFIKNVRQSDLKNYECNVNNGENAVMTIHFKGYAVPESPKVLAIATKVNEIELSWSLGLNGGKVVTSIVIEYSTAQSNEWKTVTVQNPKLNRHTIRELTPQTQYMFRVFAVNEIGNSSASAVQFGTTRLSGDAVTKTDRSKLKSSMNMTVMIAGVAGGFFVLIIAIIIVCILMRNIQRNSAKKAAENEKRLAQNANQDTATALINFLQHGGERLSGTAGSVGSGDTMQLTTSNKWEFPRERLVLQNILGTGAFGIVMKAEADGINGFNSGTTPVAVKFVKENESASAKKDLVAELELLKLIEPHTNVINLLGCCTRSEPLMVIVEFCAYGDLQSFLRSSRGIRDPYYIDCYKRPSSRLTSKELLMFGTQISKGMAHLAGLKVIHRDLAARNILVDENKVCKVSDFGFARDIYVEDHYTRKTAGGRFPIKWMAIESLLDGISTTKSDVWSFAIVLWEIITLGASPYPGMNSQEVVSFLQNGMRMDKPKHCSDELYNLLLDCWQVASHRRPNFEMLARYLDKMYNDDVEYINMRTYDDHLYINFDGNTISGGSNSATLVPPDSTSSSQHSQHSGDSVNSPMI